MKVLELSSLLLSAGFLATAMSPAVLSTNKAEDAKEFTTVGDQYNQLVPLGNNYENHALLEGNNAARRRRSSSVSRLSSSISAGDDSSYSDSDSDGERFVNGITRINQALMATGDDDGDDDEAAAAVFEGLTCGTCFSNSGHSRSRFHQETVLAEPITKKPKSIPSTTFASAAGAARRSAALQAKQKKRTRKHSAPGRFTNSVDNEYFYLFSDSPPTVISVLDDELDSLSLDRK